MRLPILFVAVVLCGCGLPSEPSQADESTTTVAQQERTWQDRTWQGRTWQGTEVGKMKVSKVQASYNGVNAVVEWSNGKLICRYASNNAIISSDCHGVQFNIAPVSGFGTTVRLKVDASAPMVMDTNELNLMSTCALRTNNVDVPLYKLLKLDTATNSWVPFCRASPGKIEDSRAIFTKGYWKLLTDPSLLAVYTDNDSGWFGVSCWDGVQAKCERWGYKEWQTRTSPNTGASVAMRPLYVACQRAAMADYCATGESFTQPNTAVDIWDAYGFVKKSNENDAWPMYADESSWTSSGALCIEASRYDSLPVGCGDVCSIGPDGHLHCHPQTVRMEDRTSCSSPLQQLIYVDTGTSEYCPHRATESTSPAQAMSPTCNACTAKICSQKAYANCCRSQQADGGVKLGAWTASCAAAAAAQCTFSSGFHQIPICGVVTAPVSSVNAP
jgi:hypothetical protein